MDVVRLELWSRGHVASVGGTAHCPSAMTAMDTSCGMVGAYILAGEVDTTCGRGTTKGVNDANSPPKNSTSTNLTTALKT